MKRSCFTLVELIVVISVISLLMAILLPALQSSKELARAAICGSNIRQLMTSLFMYEVENETMPFSFDDIPLEPPPGGWPGYKQYDRVGWWWFSYMEGLYDRANKEKSILRCPSKNLRDRKLKDNILCGNYGVNQSICRSSTGRRSRREFIGGPLSTEDILKPGETLLLADSGYAMINWWHATDEPPVELGNSIIEDTAYVPGLKINKDRALWPGMENDALNGRHHNKTVNVGFADGHVRRVKADALFVEKTDDGYKNRSPLWLPE